MWTTTGPDIDVFPEMGVLEQLNPVPFADISTFSELVPLLFEVPLIERMDTARKELHKVNAEKRIYVLAQQMPATIVDTISMYGVRTSGLTGLNLETPEDVADILWYPGVESLLPIKTESKIDMIRKFEERAIDLIPRQKIAFSPTALTFYRKFNEEDIRDAFNGYYETILSTLKESSRHESVLLQIEDIGNKVCERLAERFNEDFVKKEIKCILKEELPAAYAELKVKYVSPFENTGTTLEQIYEIAEYADSRMFEDSPFKSGTVEKIQCRIESLGEERLKTHNMVEYILTTKTAESFSKLQYLLMQQPKEVLMKTTADYVLTHRGGARAA